VDFEPGKVLISHSTWALVKDEVACRTQEKGALKRLTALVHE